ncbi:MAG: tripartite tricarboxylate transporter TctB family protein [Candidatus Methylomirabilota bacterium]
MLTRDRVAGIVIVLFSVAVMWEDRALPLGTFHHPGPGYLPLVLALILAATGILVILGGGDSPLLAALSWTEGKHALGILVGCAFAALALERLGYRLTVIVLVTFLLWVVERKRPPVVVIAALGLSLGTFYLFSNLLKVPLPLGPGRF